MADLYLRKLLRKYVTDRGTLPEHIRKRYKLCECLNRYCKHCLSQEQIKQNEAGRLMSLDDPPMCFSAANTTIVWRGTAGIAGSTLRVCRPCAEEYVRQTGSFGTGKTGWQIDEDIYAILAGVSARDLIEAEDKLRAAERRWQESGALEDHLKYLKLLHRAGNNFDLDDYADNFKDYAEFFASIPLNDLTIKGNSLRSIVGRLEDSMEARLSIWSVRPVKVTVLGLKWNPKPKHRAENVFTVLCDIKLPENRSRYDTRPPSPIAYTFSTNEWNHFNDSDDTSFRGYYMYEFTGFFSVMRVPITAHVEPIESASSVNRRFIRDRSYVLYSKGSVPNLHRGDYPQ